MTEQGGFGTGKNRAHEAHFKGQTLHELTIQAVLRAGFCAQIEQVEGIGFADAFHAFINYFTIT